MKKLLAITFAALSLMLIAPNQSQAGGKTNAFIGGLIGGVVLNEILTHNHRPRYVYPEPRPVVVYREPVAVQVCYDRWVQTWDKRRHEYIMVKRPHCHWENR